MAKNVKWVTWGQFVIFRLGFAMINLPTKFEVSNFTHYKDTKGSTKC